MGRGGEVCEGEVREGEIAMVNDEVDPALEISPGKSASRGAELLDTLLLVYYV